MAETDAPPRPFHRWKANETFENVPYTFDFCLTCGARRTSAKAAGPCPGHRPTR